jgi:hypothetical protein
LWLIDVSGDKSMKFTINRQTRGEIHGYLSIDFIKTNETEAVARTFLRFQTHSSPLRIYREAAAMCSWLGG